MRAFTTRPAAARRRSTTGLLYLVISGLLWGTGGLTGSLLGRTAGLSAISVAAFRLTTGGLLIVVFLTVSGRRWPAGRAAWSRITAIGLLAALFQSCYFTAVALTSVPLATLVTIGAAPVIVLGVDRVTGRRTGRFAVATTGLAVTGLGLLVGLPSGFPETAVLASAGSAVLAAAGFAAVTGRLQAGARTRRPHRDRVLLHHRRPRLDATGPGGRRHQLQVRARGHRPAGRPGHRTDRRGLHAVFPRPAVRPRQHWRPAEPARAPHRHHPGSCPARGAAERDRYRGRGHHRHGRDPHGAGEPRPPGAVRPRGPSIAWGGTPA